MAYQNTIRVGKGVCELKSSDKAAIEFKRFTDELLAYITK